MTNFLNVSVEDFEPRSIEWLVDRGFAAHLTITTTHFTTKTFGRIIGCYVVESGTEKSIHFRFKGAEPVQAKGLTTMIRIDSTRAYEELAQNAKDLLAEYDKPEEPTVAERARGLFRRGQ